MTKTKQAKNRTGKALRELCAAIEAAFVAGGETIGVNAGVVPLTSAVTLAGRMGDADPFAWSVAWVPCDASNPAEASKYGRHLGNIELMINGELSTSHPVRKEVR